jgi:hypothetical protein
MPNGQDAALASLAASQRSGRAGEKEIEVSAEQPARAILRPRRDRDPQVGWPC